MTPEKKLIEQGWQKQATYDNPRLAEMVEMYQKIGLEVHLEPFNAENETVIFSFLPALRHAVQNKRVY